MSIVKFRPSRNVSIFSPSAAYSIPAGQTISADFRGYGGKEFGFNRLTIGSSDFDNVTVKAILNNEQTLFNGVHLSSLRNLFLNRSLLAPFIIRENNFLTLELTNLSSSTVTANVQVHGYDSQALMELEEFNRRTNRKLPNPAFLYGSALISASSVRERVSITEKASDVRFSRMMIGSTNEADCRISLDVNNDIIKKDVFLSQINDEFINMQSLVPYHLGKRTPFDLLVTNVNVSTAMTVSFIAEAYEI